MNHSDKPKERKHLKQKVRGQRPCVGIYTRGLLLASPDCGPKQFRETWRNEEKSNSLHGIWDNLFPQGPAVFSLDNRYLLMGYFQSSGRAMQAHCKLAVEAEDVEENEQEEHDRVQDEPLQLKQQSFDGNTRIFPFFHSGLHFQLKLERNCHTSGTLLTLRYSHMHSHSVTTTKQFHKRTSCYVWPRFRGFCLSPFALLLLCSKLRSTPSTQHNYKQHIHVLSKEREKLYEKL
uniref:Uncharacterized protein n=1 Tax=Glossina pallidipes TaxID=7398 RepID=A0A1A9ZNJ0_GLOPL